MWGDDRAARQEQRWVGAANRSSTTADASYCAWSGVRHAPLRRSGPQVTVQPHRNPSSASIFDAAWRSTTMSRWGHMARVSVDSILSACAPLSGARPAVATLTPIRPVRRPPPVPAGRMDRSMVPASAAANERSTRETELPGPARNADLSAPRPAPTCSTERSPPDVVAIEPSATGRPVLRRASRLLAARPGGVQTPRSERRPRRPNAGRRTNVGLQGVRGRCDGRSARRSQTGRSGDQTNARSEVRT